MDTRTSIEAIIKQDATFCPEVSVTLCRKLPTVTIHDDSEIANEDIFMQGEDAEEFIAALDGLIEKAPEAEFGDVLKHLALPFVESCWS